MAYHIRQHPYRRPILPASAVSDATLFPSTHLLQTEVNRTPIQHILLPRSISYTPIRTHWRPSKYAARILRELHNTYFHQYPCIPCAYCSILMHPQKALWIPRQLDFIYPLTEAFPHLKPKKHPNRDDIAVCVSCKRFQMQRLPPRVGYIPLEIRAVPQSARPYLSPISLNCSLGRTTAYGDTIHNAHEHNVNNFTTYRFLTGTFGYSKNPRAHALYSGTIGAFLQSDIAAGWQSHIYHESLLAAATWLKYHHPFFAKYTNAIASTILQSSLTTATEQYADNQTITFGQSNQQNINSDIIMPSYDFLDETRNEDFHCQRLAAGFASLEGRTIPIAQDDPILECLLFPDLYPYGYGHFILPEHSERIRYQDTLIKDAKLKLLCPISDFRLHHYWPKWIYMQAEKIRIHQNSARLLRQKYHENTSRPRGGALLQQSLYTNQTIISETLTTSIPAFIRTGDTYFHRKEMHFNTMIQAFGLPTLFLTLTFSECWPQFINILKKSDNGDILSPNRPLHVTMYWYERLEYLKKYILNNVKLNSLGKIKHFVECHEFQQRGAFHLHAAYWGSASVSELIEKNFIRADMPDPILEPELWQAVTKHQIHTCIARHCGGPVEHGQCKKGFPAPLSHSTHNTTSEMRYTYWRNKCEDQYVVPYIPIILLAMDSHMNAQYVSSKGLARYMTKYMLKKEPAGIFDIREPGDSAEAYRHHIAARRMSSLEVMALLLGKPIINTSIACEYFTTDMPNFRTATVLPAFRIEEDDDNPYYIDSIEKYFERPQNALIFNNLMYSAYWSLYNITTEHLSANRQSWTDLCNRTVVKRSKQILLRFKFLRVQDAENYYYQRLLLLHPWRSEEEIKGGCASYREHHARLYPLDHQQAQSLASIQSKFVRTFYLDDYEQIIQHLIRNTSQPVQEIINSQLSILQRFPIITPHLSDSMLDSDQYRAYSTILNCIGAPSRRHWPFFFLTGSAGTGKSFLLQCIVNALKSGVGLSRRHKLLLLAPTGIAAININGTTIHSALQIISSNCATGASGRFNTLLWQNDELRQNIIEVDTIIIDEVSMVSSDMLSYLSDIFSRLHNLHRPFGKVNVILVGDLFQLPPVSASAVFHSPVWNLFYPLVLSTAHRQGEDAHFFNLLEELRMGRPSQETIQKLISKQHEYQVGSDTINTTHIVGYRQHAERLNSIITSTLPSDGIEDSIAVDYINGQEVPAGQANSSFKRLTNLPSQLKVAIGARVMFLNNTIFSSGVCNGSIGVIIAINEDNSITVAFPTVDGIQEVDVKKTSSAFYLDGARAVRLQYPLCNAFALTVHKTQGLTLPNVCLELDETIFATGQAYVAISRAKRWDDISISSFTPDAFRVDQDVIVEYERLCRIANLTDLYSWQASNR